MDRAPRRPGDRRGWRRGSFAKVDRSPSGFTAGHSRRADLAAARHHSAAMRKVGPRPVHVLLAFLLAQAPAPGTPSSTDPGTGTPETAPSLVRPEDFMLAEPGGRARQGTLP